LDFTPDGQFLCTGGSDGVMRVISIKEKVLAWEFDSNLG